MGAPLGADVPKRPDALLFVYGSLRPGSAHPHAARLAKEARHEGRATLRGRLYDLGEYPGAVPSMDGRSVVGDLYAVRDAEATLAWLDDYEDLGDPTPGAPRFVREMRPVTLASGAVERAWSYRYTGSVRTDRLVRDGDWLAHLARREPR